MWKQYLTCITELKSCDAGGFNQSIENKNNFLHEQHIVFEINICLFNGENWCQIWVFSLCPF